MSKNHGTHLFDENAKQQFDLFIKMSGLEIQYVDPDLSWLKLVCGVL
jgi:hypothetical protein